MDPVLIAGRVLLTLGCGGAALVPSTLGSADVFIQAQAEFTALNVATVMVPRHAAPPDDAPLAIQSQGESHNLDRGGAPSVRMKPAPVDLSFTPVSPVPSSPVLLRIPAHGIDARVVPVGITASGEMETPANYDDVGWYRYGVRPGEAGRAVLAGHLDSRNGPAVFFHLGELQPGDTIEVQFDGDPGLRVFTVRELAQYPVDGAPLGAIFGPVDHAELVLITCAGDFEGPDSGYSERVIVYADLTSGS